MGHSPRGAEGRPPRAHDGVGFVFTESDPFCGVDLDACVDPKTGGVASWAEGIVRELDSYAEFSRAALDCTSYSGRSYLQGDNRKGRVEIATAAASSP